MPFQAANPMSANSDQFHANCAKIGRRKSSLSVPTNNSATESQRVPAHTALVASEFKGYTYQNKRLNT